MNENPSLSRKVTKRTELLTFDNDQKLYYAGYCKIIINDILKLILVQPENEDFKPISASFNWIFIQVKQILCIYSDGVVDNFALVFENEAACKDVIEAINNTTKILNESTSDTVTEPQKELYKERFILSLMDQYNNPNIAKIVKALITTYNDEEKQIFINLLKSKNLYDTLYCSVFDEKNNGKMNAANSTNLRQSLRKRSKTAKVAENEEKNNGSDYSPSESDSDEQVDNSGKKKKIKLSNNGDSSSLKKTTLNGNKSQRKIIKKPEYEFVEVFQNGMKKTRLIIYTGDDKKFCYEYFWDQHKNRYHCCGCIRKSVRAAIYNVNTENEYIMLINNNHICQPREYDSLKLFERQKIVRKPDFEIQTILKNGNEKRTLVVFVPENRKMCHKYLSRNFSQQHFYCSRCHNKRHSVIARLCKDDNETEEYVVLGEEMHICDPKPYVSANSSQDLIIDSNNFSFISKTNLQSRIFVFNQKNRNMGYEFSETKNNFYMCLGCHQKRKSVIAKLCQNDSGEFYIRMGPNQKHVCQFRKYLPEKLEDNLIHPPNFMFYSKKTKRPHLILYSAENQKFCYDFRCCANNFFYCKGCLKFKHNVSVKVCQASDGTEFLRNGTFEHKCTPIELKDILNSGIKILEKSGLKLEGKETNLSEMEKPDFHEINNTVFIKKEEEDSSVFTELSLT